METITSYVIFRVTKILTSYCCPTDGVSIHISHLQCLYRAIQILKTQNFYKYFLIVFHMSKYQFFRSVCCRQNDILTVPSIYIIESLSCFIKYLQPSHIHKLHTCSLRASNYIALPWHSTSFF